MKMNIFFRLCTALFFIISSSWPSGLLADSSEVIVTVGPEVQVRLNEILDKEPGGIKEGAPTSENPAHYRLRSLMIQSGGELLIDEDAVLTVTNLAIYPGGSLLTDGHDLEVHARRFDAVRGDDSDREKLLPPRERAALARWKKVLGTVDSSPLSDAPHQPKRERGRDGIAPPNRHTGPSKAHKRGQNGEPGHPGTAGRDAGNIVIEAEQFLGGFFIARGGNGGNGGDGGDGGDGASGFVYSGPGLPPDDYSVEKAKAVCEPGDGGNAGAGGPGGSAGDGGNVRVRVKSNFSRQGETFMTFLFAGKLGEGGRPGRPGKPGEPGCLVFSGPHQPLGMIFDRNSPQMYRASRGAGALKGDRGSEGKGGEVLQ